MDRVAEISRAVKSFYNPLSELENFKRKYLFYADLDEELAECVAELLMLYQLPLERIHVVLTSEFLQETIEAYWQNTESAILSTLEYAMRLHARGKDFDDFWHSTNSLSKALREYWRPVQPHYNLLNFNQYCEQYKPVWKQHPTTVSRAGEEDF